MPTITRSRRSKRSNGVGPLSRRGRRSYACASMGVPSHYSPACVSCYHNVSNARRSRQDVGLECLRQPLRALRGGPFCCPGHLISLCATYHSSQRPRPTGVKTGVGSANRRQYVGLQVVVAVEAVISELVSVSPFPCFAGIYREIRRIQTEDDD
jgi:hypothetical protein